MFKEVKRCAMKIEPIPCIFTLCTLEMSKEPEKVEIKNYLKISSFVSNLIIETSTVKTPAHITKTNLRFCICISRTPCIKTCKPWRYAILFIGKTNHIFTPLDITVYFWEGEGVCIVYGMPRLTLLYFLHVMLKWMALPPAVPLCQPQISPSRLMSSFSCQNFHISSPINCWSHMGYILLKNS